MEHVSGFDWDEGNKGHCRKHGATLTEIEHALQTGPLIMSDHTGNVETRFNAVGRNSEGRHLFIVFMIRDLNGNRLIRPISARYMHAKEVQAYGQTKGSQALPGVSDG